MKVVIIGAGSTAQNIASILSNDRNFQIVGYTDKDDKSKGKMVSGIGVIGTHAILKDIFRQGIRGAVTAIGYDNNIREKYFHELKEIGFEMINVIHPSVIIDRYSTLGEGVIIGPGCVIESGVKIDKNVIIEAGTVIGPNAQIADNVCICIGCCIGGGGFIKRNAFLSPGCSIAPFVNIGKNITVKPGMSVVKSIPDAIRNKARYD